METWALRMCLHIARDILRGLVYVVESASRRDDPVMRVRWKDLRDDARRGAVSGSRLFVGAKCMYCNKTCGLEVKTKKSKEGSFQKTGYSEYTFRMQGVQIFVSYSPWHHKSTHSSLRSSTILTSIWSTIGLDGTD